ncbi:MAG: hypothetical protein AAF491_01630 [Verrucomicrobiota bacterium]
MIDSTPLPSSWLVSPPDILVIGSGVYTSTLAHVLGTELTASIGFKNSPAPLTGGTFPQVLTELRCAFLVASQSDSVADLVSYYEGLWRWLDRLSEDGEDHQISTIFVFPSESNEAIVDSLTLGLGLRTLTPDSGVGVAFMQDGLKELLTTTSKIIPQDEVSFRRRLQTDQRRQVLGKLAETLRGRQDHQEIMSSAEEVLKVFAGREHDLDLFCRQPQHSNGNLLRNLMHELVTGKVTPKGQETIPSLLIDSITAPN